MFNTNNIKEIRIKLNKSQIEVAELLNVSRSSYAMWECGKEIFPIKRLLQFCEIFNVSIDYTFGFKTESKYKKIKFDISLSGDRLKLFRKENNITQEKLATILNTNKSVICGYEKGRSIIATPFLYTICKEFNISADYLLGRTQDKEL